MLSFIRNATPPRFRILAWVGALFLLVNFLLRIALIVFDGDPANFLPWNTLLILGVGFVFDLGALSFFLIPFALLAALVADSPRARKAHGALASATLFLMLALILATSLAEVLFWNEFYVRFNFIAVDYLIYTREAVGNVLQSYAIGPLFAALLIVTTGIFIGVRRPFWAAATAAGNPRSQRLWALGAVLLLPALFSIGIGDSPREVLGSNSARELADNGYGAFVRAFRASDLDFQKFYATINKSDAISEIQAEFKEAQSNATFTGGANPLERKIVTGGAPRPLNVVLITMESLGWDYVESLGGREGLTPNLDRLGREGLLFTQLYATGTRTVRGLEAISLSLPPTPGLAVLARKNNKGFQTLGGVLKSHGYEPVFIYGGYSYFDNMNDFFGGNGYSVVDRTSLPSRDISHETIWGVADEDLFKMVLREVDARTSTGKKVFAHVMTTSNHRPFTFPAGRIDIASGTGREGAVKYSDWAIGRFMREAETRPWFKDTLFVFVADHTSRGRGRTDLPMENYRIPLIFYSPGNVEPAKVNVLASQIDVGPTLLALLNISYTSQFFGQDILTEGQHHQRALMANYLTVGYVEGGVMVELSPKRRSRFLQSETGGALSPDDARAKSTLLEAIAHYQVTNDILRSH
jgi:phosphoglycerol transferase MdoB-like AlkP superfamily enzyme